MLPLLMALECGGWFAITAAYLLVTTSPSAQNYLFLISLACFQCMIILFSPFDDGAFLESIRRFLVKFVCRLGRV